MSKHKYLYKIFQLLMDKKARMGLSKGPGKWSKVSEKSGSFEKDVEWQPCNWKALPF